MSWQCRQRIVPNPTGVTVSGTCMAGGAQVHIGVVFWLVEWPSEEKDSLSLVRQPSEVTARAGRGELRPDVAFPAPRSVLPLPSHSSTGTVRFTLSLTALALVALETARAVGPLELVMTLTSYPFVIAQYQGHAPGMRIQPTIDTYTLKELREHWLAVLKSVRYCDSILTELRLPAIGPESTRVGRKRVVNAVDACSDGRYQHTVQACGSALTTAGCGGRPPEEVARFLQENARNLPKAGRLSAPRTAVKVFLLVAHHDAIPIGQFSRGDADVAIARTAALPRLAPRWGAPDPEPVTMESS